jgi:hypothetical protein
MICPTCKSESLTIWTTIAPKVSGMWFYKGFWHNRLQCKSYQRQESGAAESGSAADAVGSQVQHQRSVLHWFRGLPQDLSCTRSSCLARTFLRKCF